MTMTYANEDIDDFFENAALSLHWVGPDGTILRANRFELDFLGYSREEYEGRSIREFHVDDDVIDDILARLARNETLADYPARLRAKDGSIKHVLINSNVRWVDGAFAHTRCFTRDVTDRTLAEEALASAKRDLEDKVRERTAELERANRELEELAELRQRFVATVSHELRTPLTSISGFAATMDRYWQRLPDHDKRHFVEIIREQSGRLTRLVDDLLTLSRITAGALKVDARAVRVRPLVEQTVHELPGDGVRVSCREDVTVVADPDHLRRIVVNYVTNAVKYGAPPVEVAAHETGRWVELRVSDQGAGVPADFVPKLFDEYAQHQLSDDPQHGTGLGLSIVRHLAEAQGGDVWYEPNAPRGAVFGVRLPKSG